MLVSINSTEITTDEIRITATNLETILLADDLFQKIDENAEEEVTLTRTGAQKYRSAEMRYS